MIQTISQVWPYLLAVAILQCLMYYYRSKYRNLLLRVLDSAYFDNKLNDDLVQYCEKQLGIKKYETKKN